MPVRLFASVPFAVPQGHSRRDFLRLALAGGAATLLPFAAGCNDDPFDPTATAVIDLRTYAGVLNALYAMQQLQGEFFNRLVIAPFPGMSFREVDAARDVRDHAGAHAGWLIERLRDDRVYDYLQFDFTGVELGVRAEAAERAAMLVERVAAGTLGAALALRGREDARIVRKMASVHARHAAAVRAVFSGAPDAFAPADAVGADGLARVEAPGAALQALRPYFRTDLQIRS
jgi:hypothetical protein